MEREPCEPISTSASAYSSVTDTWCWTLVLFAVGGAQAAEILSGTPVDDPPRGSASALARAIDGYVGAQELKECGGGCR